MFIGNNNSRINKNVLKNQYAEIIGDAFSNSRKDYNLLINALWSYNIDKYGKAISSLKKLLHKCESDRDFAVTYFFLGLCYHDTSNFDAAIDAYESSIQKDPYYGNAYTNLAVIHKSNGNFDDAIQCCKRALDANRENGIAYNILAGTYLNMRNPDKAIEYALEALRIKKNMYQAMNTLAIAYSMKNNRDKAEEYYQRSIINGCENPDMLRHLMSNVNT